MAAACAASNDWGGGEAGPAAFDGGGVVRALAANLAVPGRDRARVRGGRRAAGQPAEMAHGVAGVLRRKLFEPVNQAVVNRGHLNRNYITDVTADTPYAADILPGVRWGILDAWTDRSSSRGQHSPQSGGRHGDPSGVR